MGDSFFRARFWSHPSRFQHPSLSHRYFSAVSVDGKIMIMGGCDSSSFLDSAAVLDISSKQLIHAGKLNEQRVYSASCVLNDTVYVVGG